MTFNNGTADFTLSYTSQNRELSITATPTPAPTPLAYDFKGNVTTRYPLAGGSAYTYTWDSYDRLASAARSGQTTVNYKYDALGRLLYRDHGSNDKTLYYWLGLAKIAEGTYGDVIVLDDESIDPGEEGSPWDYGAYYTDSERGKVFGVYDYADLDVSGHADEATRVSFWAKCSGGVEVDFFATGVYDTVHILPGSGTDYVNESYPYGIYIYQNVDYSGGGWVRVDVDLANRMAALGIEDWQVDGSMTFSGTGFYLDDIMFHSDAMSRIWQLVPGGN